MVRVKATRNQRRVRKIVIRHESDPDGVLDLLTH